MTMQYVLIISGPIEVSGHIEEARGAGGQERPRAWSRYCRRHGGAQGDAGNGDDEHGDDPDDDGDDLVS